jgi:hypothetical protein
VLSWRIDLPPYAKINGRDKINLMKNVDFGCGSIEYHSILNISRQLGMYHPTRIH